MFDTVTDKICQFMAYLTWAISFMVLCAWPGSIMFKLYAFVCVSYRNFPTPVPYVVCPPMLFGMTPDDVYDVGMWLERMPWDFSGVVIESIDYVLVFPTALVCYIIGMDHALTVHNYLKVALSLAIFYGSVCAIAKEEKRMKEEEEKRIKKEKAS